MGVIPGCEFLQAKQRAVTKVNLEVASKLKPKAPTLWSKGEGCYLPSRQRNSPGELSWVAGMARCGIRVSAVPETRLDEPEKLNGEE